MSDPTNLVRQIRCLCCGRTVACSVKELLDYARDGWPTCCGETMTLVPENPPPVSSPGTRTPG